MAVVERQDNLLVSNGEVKKTRKGKFFTILTNILKLMFNKREYRRRKKGRNYCKSGNKSRKKDKKEL